MEKRTCGLCDRDYPIYKLLLHEDFKGIEICEDCSKSLGQIYKYAIVEEDEFIRLEAYVDYRLKDDGMMCPGMWFARQKELKAEAALYV